MIERIAHINTKGCGLIFGDRQVLDRMVLAASEMLRNCSRKKRIKGDCYEGMIITNFDHSIMGSLSGTEFDLTLETERGPVSTTFILTKPVTEEELATSFWGSDDIQEVIEELLSQHVTAIQ